MFHTDEIEQWKVQYGSLYEVQLDDETFILRPISKAEFARALLQETDAEKEEAVCKAAVLSPKNYSFSESCHAGLPSKLAEIILDLSMFLPGRQRSELLALQRVEMQQEEHQMDAVICSVFHKDLDEVFDWSMERTIKYYARAEWILQAIHGVPMGTESSELEQIMSLPPEMQKQIVDSQQQGMPDDLRRELRGGQQDFVDKPPPRRPRRPMPPQQR